MSEKEIETKNIAEAEKNDNKPMSKPKKKKKTTKALALIVIALFVLIAFVAGLFIAGVPLELLFAKTTTFTASELSITLPKDFGVSQSITGYTACYVSEEVSVFVTKETFEEHPTLELYTLENYRLNLLHANDLVYSDLKNADTLPYFVYDHVDTGSTITYTYFTFTFEGDDAFWIVQFATEKANAATYESQIVEWANTITISNPTENS